MAKKEKTTPEEEVQNEPELTQDAPQTDEAEAVEAAETPQPDEAETLREQLAQANDQFLRLRAEYDNYRKRTAKEKEELNVLCKCAAAKELLPVIDNVERALAHDSDNLDDYKKGVEMIGKQFADTLQKLGIEAFGEVGDAFDPNQHNAVMHIESEELGENVVSAVFGKGYRLGEKVIRPAMVQVAN